MLALLATIALFQTTEADPPPPPPAPPPAALEVERPAAPAPPAPPAPRAAKAPPAPPAPPAAPVFRKTVVVIGSGEVLRGDWPEKPSGKKVTIDDPESVDDTVTLVAEAAGWNAVLNTGRVGERLLRLKLKDVPVEEALRAALQGTGLVATRRGDVVVVAPGLEPVSARQVLSGFDKPTGKKFSGDFQDLDGRDALLEIGKAAGISIVLPKGTLGKVTAHFKDVPVEEALKAVLSQAGLEAVREGSIVTVSEREAGLSGRFDFSGELGPEIGRQVEEAMRVAEREVRKAEREARSAGKGGSSRDRERVGGDVVVEAGEAARDVHAIGGSVILRSGAEAREVVAVGGSVTLESGATARQAVAVGGDVRVGPGATVEQDAVSVGGRVQVDPAGDVGGQQTAVTIPGVSGLLAKIGQQAEEASEEPRSRAWSLAGALARYAVYLALALLLMVLFQRRVEVVAASLEANPAKALLAGLLGLAAQPFLSILLVVTVIGIPLVLVQVLGVLVAGVFGFTALAWWLGRRLPVSLSRGTMVLQLALGMAIVFVATQIPVLGWLVWTAAVILTFGAVLRTRFGQEPVMTTSMPPPPPPPPFEPPPAPAA